VRDLIDLDIRSVCIDEDLETQLGSFYRSDANLPLLRTRASKVDTVIDARLPLPDNPLVSDAQALAVLKGEMEHQLRNRFNTVVLVGASGSGKTASCFQYAAQNYAIYLECSNEILTGFQACFTDDESTAELQHTVYSTIATRAVVLAALVKYNGRSDMSPLEWLLLQLDGLGLTIGRIEARMRQYTWDRSLLNQLLLSVEAVIGGSLTIVIDEINLLVSAERPFRRYQAPMDTMQAVTSILSELSARVIIAGTNVGTNQGLRAASGVAKIVMQKVSRTAVCHFSFYSSEQVEQLLRSCLNLDEVDSDVIKQAARTLSGRARFVAGFVELFCDPESPAANLPKQDYFLLCLDRFRRKTIDSLQLEIDLCGSAKMTISSARAEEAMDALFGLWMHRFVADESRPAGPTTGGLVLLTSFSGKTRSKQLLWLDEDEIVFDVFLDEPLLHESLRLHFARNKNAINKLLRRIGSEGNENVVGERCEDLIAAVLISGNGIGSDPYIIDPLSVSDLFLRMGIPQERHVELVADQLLHRAKIHVDIAVKAETWKDVRDWMRAVVNGDSFRGYPAERVLIRPLKDAGADLIFATRASEEVLFFPVVCATAARRQRNTALGSNKVTDQARKVLLQSQGVRTNSPAAWRPQWMEFLQNLPEIKQVPILVEWPRRASAPADHMVDLAVCGVEVRAVVQDFSNLNSFVGSARAVEMVRGTQTVEEQNGDTAN